MQSLLILDLDETLIHTVVNKPSKYDFEIDTGNGYYFVTKRPFLSQFLKYTQENFDLAVWTASGKSYASSVLKNIGIDSNKLDFFYTQENCTIKFNHDTYDYYGVKTLSKIRSKFNLNRVLIIDDIELTAVNNYGNLIHIKSFTGDNTDNELLKLISYLETIKDAKNFRNIEKRGWSNNQKTIT